jgi:hypothetical protein
MPIHNDLCFACIMYIAVPRLLTSAISVPTISDRCRVASSSDPVGLTASTDVSMLERSIGELGADRDENRRMGGRFLSADSDPFLDASMRAIDSPTLRSRSLEKKTTWSEEGCCPFPGPLKGVETPAAMATAASLTTQSS